MEIPEADRLPVETEYLNGPHEFRPTPFTKTINDFTAIPLANFKMPTNRALA
jgi:hypothetical protein